MNYTVTEVDEALIATRDAMYAADVLVFEAEFEVQRCRARLDELLEIRSHIPQPRLPSDAKPGQAPDPIP